jgi:hypothetical protein
MKNIFEETKRIEIGPSQHEKTKQFDVFYSRNDSKEEISYILVHKKYLSCIMF